MYAHVYIHVYMYIHIYMYTCIHVYMCVHIMYMYMYMYTQWMHSNPARGSSFFLLRKKRVVFGCSCLPCLVS